MTFVGITSELHKLNRELFWLIEKPEHKQNASDVVRLNKCRERILFLIQKYDFHLDKYIVQFTKLEAQQNKRKPKVVADYDEFAESIYMRQVTAKEELLSSGHSRQFINYYRRALQKQIPFELSQMELDHLMSDECTYCGDTGGSIDRVDSKLGYTVTNCVSCCAMCNMMKYTFSRDLFLKQVQKIHIHQNYENNP